jgi:hypothetical protein
MKEKNDLEIIQIGLRDSVKRTLTENVTQNSKLRLRSEEIIDLEGNNNSAINNDKSLSLNIDIKEELNSEDMKLLNTFKNYCLKTNFKYDTDIYSDILVFRLLKSSNFNLKNAQQKLINYIKFSLDFHIFDIKLQDFPNLDKIKLFYPHNFHKTTFTGEPIFIQILGELKINEINKILNEPLLTKYIVYKLQELEKIIFPKCSEKYKIKIDKVFCIIDLLGLTTSLMSKKIYYFIKKQIDIVTNYFPGILGSLYFINTSLIFRTFWTGWKYLYDYRTRNRIKLLGFQYKDELLKKISEKNLPKFFGGLCNCNPYGCLFSNEGPWNNEIKVKKEKNYLAIIDKKRKEIEKIENDDLDEDFDKIENDIKIDNINNENNNNINNNEDLIGPNDIN